MPKHWSWNSGLSRIYLLARGNAAEVSSDQRPDGERPDADQVSGRDPAAESGPTASGHSTADTQAERNREDESSGGGVATLRATLR
jgi:hypothetical protein